MSVDVEWRIQSEGVIKNIEKWMMCYPLVCKMDKFIHAKDILSPENFILPHLVGKKLDINILPTLNLPVKSCETKKPPRKILFYKLWLKYWKEASSCLT